MIAFRTRAELFCQSRIQHSGTVRGIFTVGALKAHHASIENVETGELHEVTIPKTFSLRGVKKPLGPHESSTLQMVASSQSLST